MEHFSSKSSSCAFAWDNGSGHESPLRDIAKARQKNCRIKRKFAEIQINETHVSRMTGSWIQNAQRTLHRNGSSCVTKKKTITNTEHVLENPRKAELETVGLRNYP